MWLSILAFVISLVPSVLIVVWMFRRRKDDLAYKKGCKSALIRGLVSVLPIVLVSGALYLATRVFKWAGIADMPPLLYAAIYNFIVLAFAEELVKYLSFRFLLKKKRGNYSWADVVAFMVIIGTAFGLVEDIPYAIGANAMTMFVRGLTMGHVGYALIMGWFYGKRLQTGKKGYDVLAFLVPWAIHGLYDFSLSQELMAVNDNFMFLGLGLAALSLALLIVMICFFVRVRKRNLEKYLTPVIFAAETDEGTEETEDGAESPAATEATTETTEAEVAVEAEPSADDGTNDVPRGNGDGGTTE